MRRNMTATGCKQCPPCRDIGEINQLTHQQNTIKLSAQIERFDVRLHGFGALHESKHLLRVVYGHHGVAHLHQRPRYSPNSTTKLKDGAPRGQELANDRWLALWFEEKVEVHRGSVS